MIVLVNVKKDEDPIKTEVFSTQSIFHTLNFSHTRYIIILLIVKNGDLIKNEGARMLTKLSIFQTLNSSKLCGGPRGRAVRALFLNHSIISPLCLLWVRAPLWPRETSHVLLADVPGGFSLDSPVFAHLLIGPSHMS